MTAPQAHGRSTDDGAQATAAGPLVRWIASSLEVKEGRDPLGLQTMTQDGLMPLLLPGLLEQTRRARYFSVSCSGFRAAELEALSIVRR